MDMEKTLKNILKKIKLSEPTISTILGAFVILVVGILIFNYFKAERAELPLAEMSEKVSITAEEEEAGVQLKPIEKENGETEIAKIYKVQQGDYLSLIAEKIYGSGQYWTQIAQENNLTNPNLLVIDQELKLPELNFDVNQKNEAITQKADVQDTIDADQYTVAKGDHLWDIAVRAYSDGYKWVKIAQANNLANPDLLTVGQELTLPR